MFQNMASFRNMLVHRYESIDDSIVFGIFSKRLRDFHHFIETVSDWLRKSEKRD
ncbi:MAG: HepT-like ribonuclease domain-containing protein [Thermodesulfobacteriota bacterium]